MNNKTLELVILGYLAKYQKMYKVKIYGFIIMGNHLHLLAAFPEGNKARFMRSFGAITGASAPLTYIHFTRSLRFFWIGCEDLHLPPSLAVAL